jgi:hypothetical protein
LVSNTGLTKVKSLLVIDNVSSRGIIGFPGRYTADVDRWMIEPLLQFVGDKTGDVFR